MKKFLIVTILVALAIIMSCMSIDLTVEASTVDETVSAKSYILIDDNGTIDNPPNLNGIKISSAIHFSLRLNTRLITAAITSS